MSRANWKTPFIDKSLLKRLSPNYEKKPTWSRRSTIYPAAVGLRLLIHNGKEMINRKIKPEMVGHKLGEFVPTRKTFVPKKEEEINGTKSSSY
uniref:ribosomal protein S19 n=1 Tax=Sporochnus bolleanus TaxID=461143 RepID=UPI002E784BB8|nr:ribosomal protein S19 [Sporochnus bolleanus]WBP70336.1 ribosomal protein S19 [Sporochnus bolleanus]